MNSIIPTKQSLWGLKIYIYKFLSPLHCICANDIVFSGIKTRLPTLWLPPCCCFCVLAIPQVFSVPSQRGQRLCAGHSMCRDE